MAPSCSQLTRIGLHITDTIHHLNLSSIIRTRVFQSLRSLKI
uniref:Uncharacterized protein n=1 Tax=Arundo donax TaxID=35708 RepID=A0A0A8XUZ2_ARUDO